MNKVSKPTVSPIKKGFQTNGFPYKKKHFETNGVPNQKRFPNQWGPPSKKVAKRTKRSQNNQGCGKIRAPGKQRLGTNKVPGWARSANEPTHILGNGDPETPRMLDKWGPQINEVPKQTMQCPQTNKSPEQKGPQTNAVHPKNKVPQQLRSPNSWGPSTNNYPNEQIHLWISPWSE